VVRTPAANGQTHLCQTTKPCVVPHHDLVVVVRVTTDCSLGCLHCGYSRDVQRISKDISYATLESLGQRLSEHKTTTQQQVLVSWLGGEPFQWCDWREVTRRYVEENGLRVSVTTNGLALASPKTRSDALRLFSEITLSLDGFADHHDQVRQAPHMFERLKRVIELLCRERDPQRTRLRLNTVLTRSNIRQFEAFCDCVGQWGIDEVTFNQLGGNDRPEYFVDHGLRPPDLELLIESLPNIRARAATHGMRIQGSPEYLHRIASTVHGRAIPIDDCAPGSSFLFIDEAGMIGPCSFTAAGLGIKVQDIAPGEFSQLCDRLRTRLGEVAPNACRDCHATHVFAKFG
jgi:MoaA/NifB/PqqE/SkfB family radical SAM enzyme